MAKAPAKTNAMRILDREGIPYKTHTYDAGDGQVDGVSVAAKIGVDPKRVYKTLVARSREGPLVFVIPVEEELDLKKAARAAGVKAVTMLPLKELLAATGYVRGGCSPVGMKKPYPTVLQKDVELLETVVVSGGRVGLQLEFTPVHLVILLDARTADVIWEKEC